MEKTAYARSVNSRGTQQTVREHLLETAKLTADNASAFDAGEEGHLAGLFHDLGKHGELFQMVLHHKVRHIDHALPGAVFAQMIRQLTRRTQVDIALAIAAHHTGLTTGDPKSVGEYRDYYTNPNVDKGEHKSPVHNGRELSIPDAALLHGLAKKCVGEVGYVAKQLPERPELDTLERMLYQRMLLSALVDADYSSAAHDEDPDYLEKSAGAPLNPEGAFDRLMAYVASLREASKATANVNAVRDELFSACVAGGKSEPGLFTLTGPTGTGKTMALLAFALSHAKRHGLRRVIVVLPFLSIIEQNAEEYRKVLGAENVLEAHSQATLKEDAKLLAERWSAPVIVTTSVRFFEMLFRAQPTQLRALHQVAGSVVVFDEAQTLPTRLARATLKALGELSRRYHCSVLFSTATQPSFDLLPDTDWRPRELSPKPQCMYNRMRRTRADWRCGSPTPLSAIAGEMAEGMRCCAIVNLTAHAVELFRLLQSRSPKDEIFHISARMCAAHRTDVIERIKARLKAGLPCRLVATQAIEAGVDLDFDRVYRALAPLNSIIQAAGRCNRNGRLAEGVVVVFVPDEERLYPDTDYKNNANKVKLMLESGDIDIHSLSDMLRYDRLVFGDELNERKALWEAIELQNFELVSNEYRLIPDAGVNVLVPYGEGEHRALYERLKFEALEEGIGNSWMRLARPITVTSFLRHDRIRRDFPWLERLRYCPARKGQMPQEESDWYVLNDPGAYDEHMGFLPEQGELPSWI